MAYLSSPNHSTGGPYLLLTGYTIFNESLLQPPTPGVSTIANASTVNASSVRGYNAVNTEPVRYIIVVLYWATFVFGTLGNTLTIFGIAMSKKMKSVATCFMLNLAIADDLFMASLPFMALTTIKRNWFFGSHLCKFLSVMHGVNCYASIFTMTAMSFDRYLAVVYPLTSLRYRKPRNAFCVCAGLWFVCAVIMTPYWLYADTGLPGFDGSYKCQINWPRTSHFQHQFFWVNFELVVGFALPILVMFVCYCQLLYAVVRQPHGQAVIPQRTRRSIRKVTGMVVTVTVVFITCWTPYHVLQYMKVYKQKTFVETGIKPDANEVIKFVVFNTVAQALVFVSSCCNPFIYFISSREFRRVYVTTICRCCMNSAALKRLVSPTSRTFEGGASVMISRANAARETTIRCPGSNGHRKLTPETIVKRAESLRRSLHQCKAHEQERLCSSSEHELLQYKNRSDPVLFIAGRDLDRQDSDACRASRSSNSLTSGSFDKDNGNGNAVPFLQLDDCK